MKTVFLPYSLITTPTDLCGAKAKTFANLLKKASTNTRNLHPQSAQKVRDPKHATWLGQFLDVERAEQRDQRHTGNKKDDLTKKLSKRYSYVICKKKKTLDETFSFANPLFVVKFLCKRKPFMLRPCCVVKPLWGQCMLRRTLCVSNFGACAVGKRKIQDLKSSHMASASGPCF